MKTGLFISPPELKTPLSRRPLLLFKMGLGFCCLVQAIGNLLDAPLMFSDHGLFPDTLAREYFPSGLADFGSHWGIPLCILMALLSLLTFVRKAQNLSFALLGILGILIARRNFIFIDKGDFALLFLTLLAALSPPATWRQRNDPVVLADLMPLFALNFIVYAVNFVGKISGNWGEGIGLFQTLHHLEISRTTAPFLTTLQVSILNYAAIGVVLALSVAPLISFRQRRLRNSLVVLGLLYHLCANFLVRLSWLSLPFVAFELLLWAPAPPLTPRATEDKPWRRGGAYLLLLLAFFGSRDPDDFFAFNDSPVILGHNWSMFAPAPSMTGSWQVAVAQGAETKQVPLQELGKDLTFSVYQHEYKYFYNLRRSELFPVAAHLASLLCERFKDTPGTRLRLIYDVHLFKSDDDVEIKYPETKCGPASDFNSPDGTGTSLNPSHNHPEKSQRHTL